MAESQLDDTTIQYILTILPPKMDGIDFLSSS